MTAQPLTVAAVRAGKQAQRRRQYVQRLGRRRAVEPGPALTAWEAAVDRDDAREASGDFFSKSPPFSAENGMKRHELWPI